MTTLDPIPFRVAALEQQVVELRAEIAALKAAAEPADRKAYMRSYMAKRRAEQKKAPNAQQGAPGL